MFKKQVFISLSILIGFFILLKVGLSWKNSTTIHVYTEEEQRKISAEPIPDVVELVYTEQEQRDIAKWKDKTMDDLVIDALCGDRAALYNLGSYFLLGLDLPIDVKRANTFLGKASSLGFAPALDSISRMYINDESNAFLGFVYQNLTISFGHTEFTLIYHDFRNKMIESSGKKGQRIFDEMEMIASHKKAIILKNEKYVQDKQNKKEECWVSLEDITDEDYQYDNDYWLDVYNGDIGDNVAESNERDEAYLDNLHRVYYQAILSDSKNLDLEVQRIMKEMEHDSYSAEKIESFKKQARSQAKKDYKYVCKIKKDAEEAKKSQKIIEEYRAALKN